MADPINSRALSPWLRAANWVGEHADPLLALILGVAAGLSSIFGWLKGADVSSATLVVLSVVAFSLLRERSLRLKASARIEEANEGIRSLHSGHPYHVVLDETTWEITARNGTEARAVRVKRLKFDQNDVLSLYDFAQSDASDETHEYSPGEKVYNFKSDGRRYSLIALGRFYSRGEEIDFTAKRTMKNAFCEDQERVNIRCLDTTDRQKMTVVWPRGRRPTAVRLGRTSAQNIRQSEEVTHHLTKKRGHAVYTVDTHKPERGSQTTIEWDW